MIDHFTREQFEDALPKRNDLSKAPLWKHDGVKSGEHQYSIPVQTEQVKVWIVVRSSVAANGTSADTGEDSIRAYLMSPSGPAAPKINKYTTRVPGWQGRLQKILRELYKIGLSIKVCPKDPQHGQMTVFKAKKGKPENEGKLFQKCKEGDTFEWLNIQ